METTFQALEKTINAELELARQSQKEGNEGKARVCARRAAGWAVGWYAHANSLAEPHSNALQHLGWLTEYPGIGEEIREAASRLITKLAPDGSLPFDHDPIDDAQKIIQAVLGFGNVFEE